MTTPPPPTIPPHGAPSVSRDARHNRRPVSNSSDDATGRGTAGSSRRNLVAAVFLCMTALFAPVPTHAHDTELYRFPPPWLMEGDCRRGNYVTSCLCSLAIEVAQAKRMEPRQARSGEMSTVGRGTVIG